MTPMVAAATHSGWHLEAAAEDQELADESVEEGKADERERGDDEQSGQHGEPRGKAAVLSVMS